MFKLLQLCNNKLLPVRNIYFKINFASIFLVILTLLIMLGFSL